MLPDALGTAHGTQLVMDMLVILRLSLAITTPFAMSLLCVACTPHWKQRCFKSDRQNWTELQDVLLDKHRNGAITVLNGKPDTNKWLLITCFTCGRFVFVEYSTKGARKQDDEALARGRQNLFKFFMLPYRASESELRREVCQNDFRDHVLCLV